MGQPRLRIGLSACFMHADPTRALFKGKTLQYVEQSMAHWVMEAGELLYMIPSPLEGERPLPITLDDMLEPLDGLLLHGGSDMAPESYGEAPIGRWTGDAIRDRYEMALLRACMDRGMPVLGICRGLQVLNVALGGTLYQDIETQRPGCLTHRDWNIYDQNAHDITLTPGSALARCYPGQDVVRVNSVHHQAVKDVAPGLVVEARSTEDDIVEALRLPGDKYVAAVQWHPEFMEPTHPTMMDTRPLLDDFLDAARRYRAGA